MTNTMGIEYSGLDFPSI